MSRNKNKRARKLQLYRDKLLKKATILEGQLRHYREIMGWIRKCLQQEDILRAYALASDPEEALDETRERPEGIQQAMDANELAKELTLVYRFLIVERRYTAEVQVAANNRDYLRVAALSAQHQAETIAHERMLSEWSQDHGIKKALLMEGRDEDVI